MGRGQQNQPRGVLLVDLDSGSKGKIYFPCYLENYLVMCGRTACTLAADVFPKACQYKDRNGNMKQPQWKNNDYSKYSPSYNVSPQSYTPVLVSSKHSCSSLSEQSDLEDNSNERELHVMKWGLVPSWHRGNPTEFSYKMNNARIESITEKKSFKNPLEKGRRCVVLAEGFYEWQAGNGGRKQPYFIYFKKDVKTGFEDALPILDELEGRPLLTMAGVFDEWKPPASQELDEPLYTYSVITLEAVPPFNTLHHRVPAILKDDAAIRQWLDSENISCTQALKLLKPIDCLDWHPVSMSVNNSRYNEPDCLKKIDLTVSAKKAERAKITNWFQKSVKKRESSQATENEVDLAKRQKQDN